MALPPSIPVVAGALAVFSTSALIAVHSILAHQLDHSTSSTTHIVAIVSAIVEGAVLAVFCAHAANYLRRRTQGQASENGTNEKEASKLLHQSSGLWFGLSILLCTAAAAVSVAALVNLGKSAVSLPPTIFGSGAVPFLAGASVTLGVCYAAQLLFLITQFMAVRVPLVYETAELSCATNGYRQASSNSRTPNNGTRPSTAHVKGIRYSQTLAPAPSGSRRGRMASLGVDGRSPPGPSGGRSTTETLGSLRSSLSNAVRPITSQTRLLARSTSSLQSLRHSTSFANSPSPPTSTYIVVRNRDRRSSTSVEDDFDSWDTSAVSPQNRRAVLEGSVPSVLRASRFLETIPASPTVSHCPSPGMPLDLMGPPRPRRRSRSYSPVPRASSASSMSTGFVAAATTTTRVRSHSLSPPDEAHIHPLFRSDSPTPPPAVSAGTVVTAAPNAGQMFAADVQSLRTMNRMRSGSLPVVSSPLSRQGSFDDFAVRRALAGSPSALGGAIDHEEEKAHMGNMEHERQTGLGERTMTPPIPDWILSAGTESGI